MSKVRWHASLSRVVLLTRFLTGMLCWTVVGAGKKQGRVGWGGVCKSVRAEETCIRHRLHTWNLREVLDLLNGLEAQNHKIGKEHSTGATLPPP